MSELGKILIVEDEPDLRETTRDFLAECGFGTFEAGGLDEAKRIFSSETVNLVIADIFLGPNRLGGIELIEAIQESGVPVVLISGNASVEALKRAINCGANFFLEKPFELNSLESIVKNLMSAPSDAALRAEQLVKEHHLTAREEEIFKLLSKGLSNREIAASISTSERTVKAHISSIFRKTKVSSRAELLSLLLADA